MLYLADWGEKKIMKRKECTDAVIFDMDGLMIDTERLAAGGWKKAGEEMGFPIDDCRISQIRGRNVAAIRQLFLDWYGGEVSYEQARAIRVAYVEEEIRSKGVPVKAGLLELLEYLKEETILAAVASSTARAVVEEYLSRVGVLSWLDTVVCGDEVQKCKPDPEIFLKAAEKLKADPKKCIVLEDSFNGIRAGYASGGKVIMVPDLDPPTEEAEKLCFRICPTLAHVKKVLEEKI